MIIIFALSSEDRRCINTTFVEEMYKIFIFYWLISYPKLKAQISFSDKILPCICGHRRRLVVVAIVSHFLSSAPDSPAKFDKTWYKATWGGLS